MNKAIIVISAFLAALLAWTIYQNVEYYDERLDSGWSAEAKINDFLALQRFTERRGSTTSSIPHLPAEHDFLQSDLLLIPNANALQIRSQKEKVIEWVKQGGILIIGVGLGDSPPIISDLGFSTFTDSHEYSYEDEIIEDDDAEEENNYRSIAEKMREQNERIRKRSEEKAQQEDKTTVRCTNLFGMCGAPKLRTMLEDQVTVLQHEPETFIKLAIHTETLIDHELFYSDTSNTYTDIMGIEAKIIGWNGNDYGTTYAKVALGDGYIHILSNLDFLTNRYIAHYDHAKFFADISLQTSSAMILYGRNMPSLSTLLYRHFFEALISFALLISCAIFYFGKRLGSLIELPVPERRSNAERFNAIAQFRWRSNNTEALVSPIREDILARASRRWPKFRLFNSSKQAELLASICTIPAINIESALTRTIESNDTLFIQTVKVLQELRKHI